MWKYPQKHFALTLSNEAWESVITVEADDVSYEPTLAPFDWRTCSANINFKTPQIAPVDDSYSALKPSYNAPKPSYNAPSSLCSYGAA